MKEILKSELASGSDKVEFVNEHTGYQLWSHQDGFVEWYTQAYIAVITIETKKIIILI